MPSVGRKLLLAGRGGLNLTHTESGCRSSPATGRRRRAGAGDRRVPGDGAAGLGGGPGPGDVRRARAAACFPTAMKASPLLRAWLAGWRPGCAAPHRAIAGGVGTMTAGWRSPAGWPARAAARRHRAGAGRRQLAAAGLRRHLGRAAGRPASPSRRCGRPIAASPSPGATIPRPLRRPAAEADRPVASRAHGAGEAVVTEDGIEGGAVYALRRRSARRHRGRRSGPARDRSAARPVARRSWPAAWRAARPGSPWQLSCARLPA